VALLGFFALIGLRLWSAPVGDEIGYSQFKKEVEAGRVERVVISDTAIQGRYRQGETVGDKARFFTAARVPDDGLVAALEKKGVEFTGSVPNPLMTLLGWILPALIFVGAWVLIMRRFGPAQGGVMSFGKSRAKIVAEDATGITFADVAGQEEAKEELTEIVRFLSTPERYRALGGKLPRGVLLVGPPGTGKTLLAKAVAGEAKVTFFSISGSEFVELFVGMGAARVRDLFAQAQSKAPCIVFIDELDALGKARGIGGMVGGHDERENTLNQLLVEMDGFDTTGGVVILAATNRPEVLDPALLRAGRFDRQVLVDRPDRVGREAILRVHARAVKLADDVDLALLAQRTPGFVGADLANIVNEAALLAARSGKPGVTMRDFEEAIDRVVAGLEKKNRLINPEEKRRVAVHELGHALVAAFTPGADRVHKISIVPRGLAALGYTQQLPTEDRYLMTRGELEAKIDVLLGGRAAEEVLFGDVSTGAHNDLQRATEIVQSMVLEYGMGNTLGALTHPRRRGTFLGDHAPLDSARPYSEATAQALDEEMKRLMEQRMERAVRLIREKRALVESLAVILLEKEVIEADEFARLVDEHVERAARNAA
jgi:cell division protease FtsH